MTEHYLDNSATTQVLQEAADRAASFMTQTYGNASSLHTKGYEALCALEAARETIAKSIGAKKEELFFTSGGTEGDNLAILGAARARKRLGNKLITTQIEHPAVLAGMKALQAEGFEVVFVPPEPSGGIDPARLEAEIDERTILVSMMLVNHETGARLPVEEAAQSIKRKRAPALLHTDAVQAYLKEPLSVTKLGVDLLTVSGHKVHAPKGVGALYVRKGVKLHPMAHGGGQEGGLRSGTEALPLIAAFETAVQAAGRILENRAMVTDLNEALRAGLRQRSDVTVHSPDDGSPYILNISAGRVRAETMLHFLSARGVFVSAGSACGKAKPSHVLQAMQVPKAEVETALRISFSHKSTREDVQALLAGLAEGLATLKQPR